MYLRSVMFMMYKKLVTERFLLWLIILYHDSANFYYVCSESFSWSVNTILIHRGKLGLDFYFSSHMFRTEFTFFSINMLVEVKVAQSTKF